MFKEELVLISVEKETALESLEGKRENPRLKPPFPAVKGLWQCPTVVNNVETIAAAVVPIIDITGAEYAKIGVGRSTGTKLISACGNINKPRSLRNRHDHHCRRIYLL